MSETHNPEAAGPNVDQLVTSLTDKDGVVRKRARDVLVEEIGRPAVPKLLPLLTDRRTYVRWEAAKALSQLGDARSAPDLVQALQDNDGGIRWMAAEGLAAIGEPAMPPLLRALMDEGESVRLREGARHMLNNLERADRLPQPVVPVLQALKGAEPSAEVPRAAKNALDALT
jgi:HEAT repeat protein